MSLRLLFRSVLLLLLLQMPAVASAEQPASDTLLTPFEKSWLEAHPPLVLAGIPDAAPFEYRSGERWEGMVTDLVALLQQRLGLKIERRDYPSWPAAIEGLAVGEVDFVSIYTLGDEARQRFATTEPYLSYPMVLAVRNDMRFIGSLDDLDEERVAVVRDIASHDYLSGAYPRLNLVLVSSVEDGLFALANGEVEVMAGNIPTLSHSINKLGLTSIKLTGITPYTNDLAFAVRPDWPMLAAILDKGLQTITPQERGELYRRWVSLEVDERIDYQWVWRITALSVLILGAVVYWNRKLSREVAVRIQSEEALRQSEARLRAAKRQAEHLAREADDASRAKSEFLANMSHEIRTPMNAVIGYTELLESKVSDPQLRGYLDAIRNGGRALLTIINDILDLSRIESGKMRIEYAPVNPARLLQDIADIFTARVSQKGLVMQTQIAEDLPHSLMLDEIRLRQVLFNLLGNAIKFTHEGHIALGAYCSVLEEDPDFVELVLFVEDSGIGIAADQHSRIFNAFEQQEGQSNREYGGTGLGLAISKRLVEIMNGEIGLQSVPGEGSRFEVRLSHVAISQDLEQRQPERLTRPPFGRGSILVVDDVDTNRALIRDHFAGTRVVVNEAGQGAEAVELARRLRPDVILMDLRMPVMDGYEATRLLKEDKATRNIPVIGLTGSNLSADASYFASLGFHCMFRKPVEWGPLYDVLVTLLPVPEAGATATDHAHPQVMPPPVVSDQALATSVATFQAWATQAEELADSGDLESIRRFAETIARQASGDANRPLRKLAAQVVKAAEAFDLAQLQNLLQHELPRRLRAGESIQA